MTKLKKNGFTLIELIAVLVIMAILALIVIPLVMNIIRKARIAADKRSVDAYGRSIELAIASYLLDTGKFPTEISQLTIEYSGDTVTCTTEQINQDSSVYLSGCKVRNRTVDGYIYGIDKSSSYTSYKIGDEVTYNEVDYYVIKDSGVKKSTVTLLKAEPLSYENVQKYSVEISDPVNNHNGYGEMRYHSSSNNYATSFVKIVVDAWKVAQAPLATEVRLLKSDEIEFESKELDCCGGCGQCIYTGNVATNEQMFSSDYEYWLMPSVNDSEDDLWYVDYNGVISNSSIQNHEQFAIRPVIVLDKSVLSS